MPPRGTRRARRLAYSPPVLPTLLLAAALALDAPPSTRPAAPMLPAVTSSLLRVGLVGHCTPDTSFLTITVGKAVPGAKVTRLTSDAAVARALADGVDVLLVNRALEPGFDAPDGVELIRALKPQADAAGVRLLLVSNFADAQRQAVEAGALPGFGKSELATPRVRDLLRDLAGAAAATP